MEDTNISVQKFTVYTDTDISAHPLETSDAQFLIS
jgi:hypothetical protein